MTLTVSPTFVATERLLLGLRKQMNRISSVPAIKRIIRPICRISSVVMLPSVTEPAYLINSL